MMTLVARLQHIHRRRRELRGRYDPSRSFKSLEESCIPSYCHPNLLAAYVAWWRLFVAARLAATHVHSGPVLDFGASCGEFGHLLPGNWEYHFVEQHEALASELLKERPQVSRQHLERLPSSFYKVVFALDSLEHNDDPGMILSLLKKSLCDDGVLILSGPTENLLYRLGRRVSGFGGHYHKTTIYEIHKAASQMLSPLNIISGPVGTRLFIVSAWKPCAA